MLGILLLEWLRREGGLAVGLGMFEAIVVLAVDWDVYYMEAL